MPRIEEAHRPPPGLGLAVRDGFRAGQAVLALGDVPAHRLHVAGPPGRVQRRGAALVRGQRGGLLGRRLRVALDGDVVLVIGDPVAEREQVVLGRGLGLGEVPLPAQAARAPDEQAAEHHHEQDDAEGDQDITQRMRRRLGRGTRGTGACISFCTSRTKSCSAAKMSWSDWCCCTTVVAMFAAAPAGFQHALVVGAEVPQPAVQEADDELLLLSAQRADDLAHRGVVPGRAGGRGHQVDVIVADGLFQLRLLALGDEAASVGGDADVVRAQAVRQRVGPSRGTRQPDRREHAKHAEHQREESSHVAPSLHR